MKLSLCPCTHGELGDIVSIVFSISCKVIVLDRVSGLSLVKGCYWCSVLLL